MQEITNEGKIYTYRHTNSLSVDLSAL
jgi:hypothetical protein